MNYVSRCFLAKILWIILKIDERWVYKDQYHQNQREEERMTTLEESLILEAANNIKQKIQELGRQEQRIQQLNRLNSSYQNQSISAASSESKTDILCIADRIKEFTEKRKFYQLNEAIRDALDKIRRHNDQFPNKALESNEVFQRINMGINAHKKSVEEILNVGKTITKLKGPSKNSTAAELKKWAENLEKLGEELEDNIPFFSTEIFDNLEYACEQIVLSSREKNLSDPEREQWRRRLRYATGFILNLIETAKEEALEEELEVLQGFELLGESSFKDAWNSEDY